MGRINNSNADGTERTLSTTVQRGKRKRAHKRFQLDTSPLNKKAKIRYDSRESVWDDENLSKIIEYLKTNGFRGEYEEVRKMFPANLISETGLREMFHELSKWSEPVKEDTKESDPPKKRSAIKPSPIEEWITMIRDCIEAQRHSTVPAQMLKWIAMFEEHPDPASCCEVDYKAIYMYISSLLDGHIPKQLNPQSALKLVSLYDDLVKIVRASATESQALIVKSAKLSICNQKITRDEKNKLLRNRRRTEWSEEEKKQANILKSDDLDEIKRIYCENRGLNPFSFPPGM
ncbi:uncharacterized protein LOC130702783 [Daphnia carinata]|uniref:uncharacterized protein LOC130702783 n=1 Tax=Daphnia carinata TaxID=120202 RepID=UPI00257B5E1A|nr:uncharacterized protein LOC130702783 [Daphnia carinata]